jgi:hypothetical protein
VYYQVRGIRGEYLAGERDLPVVVGGEEQRLPPRQPQRPQSLAPVGAGSLPKP